MDPTDNPVDVHLFAAARAAAGLGATTARPGSLADIIDALCQEFPGLARVIPQCSYLIDEVATHGDPASVMVTSGSRLDVLPPFAGG